MKTVTEEVDKKETALQTKHPEATFGKNSDQIVTKNQMKS